MVSRRDYFRVEEVGAELESLGVPHAKVVLLTDLQQGVLDAFVEFPDFRSGLTPISKEMWEVVEADGGSLPTGRRRGPWGGFRLTVNDFFTEEEELLRLTILALALRDLTSIPAEYRTYLESKALLDSKMTEKDWQSLISLCGYSWRQLSELEGRTVLHPMVKATHMRAYLLSVKSDRAFDIKAVSERNPGGRPESPHWAAIYKAAIRKLGNRPNILQDGEVQEFAGHLYTALKKTVAGSKYPLPNADTIAQRLRIILKQADRTGLTGEPS